MKKISVDLTRKTRKMPLNAWFTANENPTSRITAGNIDFQHNFLQNVTV